MGHMSNLGKEIAAGNQPMFMTPDEVVEHFHLGDTHYMDNPNKVGPKSAEQSEKDKSLLDYKRVDSMHPMSYDGNTSLYDSIAEHGVKEPLQIGRSPYIPRPIMTNGHHRLAASRHLNPKQFIPLDYH
jgi:hypothetical protein